ncbi:MAG: hypothetical protein LW630_12615 [Saprospiraceae bacterium]|nr:hypothetical protein [Saprospiraceae bacterium]
MNRTLFFLLIATAWFAACKNNAEAPAGDGVHFGATIDSTGSIPYTALLSQMASADSVNAKVRIMGFSCPKIWLDSKSSCSARRTEKPPRWKT